MNAVSSLVLMLGMALDVSALACGETPSTDQKLLPLQLLPKEDRAATGPALAGSRWIYSTDRDILGRGGDTILQFGIAALSKEFVIEITTRWHPGANTKTRTVEEKTQTYPCTLEGPVLRYGSEAHSFVVVPERGLILNAVVPLGGGQWYYANRHKVRSGKSERPDWDEHLEYLFEFQDDPLQQAKGKAVMQRCLRGKILGGPCEFTVKNGDRGKLISLLLGGAVAAEFTPSLDGKYGLCPEINMRSVSYVPAPK